MQRIFSLWWVTLILSLATMLVAPGPIVDLKITKARQDLSNLQAMLEQHRVRAGSIAGTTAATEMTLLRQPRHTDAKTTA